MTCITLFVQPMAMATTQLACVIHNKDASSWRVEPKAELKHGKGQLRMRWTAT